MKKPPQQDYYEVLGVAKDANDEEIKTAWKNKIKEAHPDVGGDEEKAKIINVAYECLSNPQARASYDNQGQGNAFDGFDPFGGGMRFDIHEIFERMSRGQDIGGFSFATSVINQEVDLPLHQVVGGSEIELNTQVGKLKFSIPNGFRSGHTFRIRVNAEDKKSAVVINLKIHIIIPDVSEEKARKIKEILF